MLINAIKLYSDCRCVRLEAALRMTSKYRESRCIVILSNRSRGTLMSYTDYSAQRRFKSKTPFVLV